jgi:hypothetical protein
MKKNIRCISLIIGITFACISPVTLFAAENQVVNIQEKRVMKNLDIAVISYFSLAAQAKIQGDRKKEHFYSNIGNKYLQLLKAVRRNDNTQLDKSIAELSPRTAQ